MRPPATSRRSTVQATPNRARTGKDPHHRRPGLRPTPDRVRETLFNWLAGELDGARCLDLFAGTGALGFEAASRGAHRVVLVERDPGVAAHLERQARDLVADAVQVVCADARDFIDRCAERFDVVFLDPPFEASDPQALVDRIAAAGILAPSARVYLERPAGAAAPALPPGWRCRRERRAGRVHYALLDAGHEPDCRAES